MNRSWLSVEEPKIPSNINFWATTTQKRDPISRGGPVCFERSDSVKTDAKCLIFYHFNHLIAKCVVFSIPVICKLQHHQTVEFLSKMSHALTSVSYFCSKSTINLTETPLWSCLSALRSIFTVEVHRYHFEWLPITSNMNIFTRHTLSKQSPPSSFLTMTAGMWTSFSQLLFICRRLSPDILHGWKKKKIKHALLGLSLVPWKNQHPLERRTFFSTLDPP